MKEYPLMLAHDTTRPCGSISLSDEALRIIQHTCWDKTVAIALAPGFRKITDTEIEMLEISLVPISLPATDARQLHRPEIGRVPKRRDAEGISLDAVRSGVVRGKIV